MVKVVKIRGFSFLHFNIANDIHIFTVMTFFVKKKKTSLELPLAEIMNLYFVTKSIIVA
mgnify:CR=1 FL=1